MKIKNIIQLLSAAAIFMVAGCSDSSYAGGDYIGFGDTAIFCPVYQDVDKSYEIAIAATQTASYDRSYAVEVVESGSNAIEGIHYVIPSYNFTIAAGETKATLPIKGVWDNFESTDSVGVTLRLVVPEAQQSTYNAETQEIAVSFVKVCDFNREQLTGYAIMSSWFNYDMVNTLERLVQIEVDPDNEDGVIIRNAFTNPDIYRDNYDMKISFSHENMLTPWLTVEDDQILYSVRSLLEVTGGDGWVRAKQNTSNTSFYNMCQGFAVIYLDYWVLGDDGGYLGTYFNAIEWITDEEAEVIIREGRL